MRPEKRRKLSYTIFSLISGATKSILDQTCWYLNESSLHEQSEYAMVIMIQGNTDIYRYLALGVSKFEAFFSSEVLLNTRKPKSFNPGAAKFHNEPFFFSIIIHFRLGMLVFE